MQAVAGGRSMQPGALARVAAPLLLLFLTLTTLLPGAAHAAQDWGPPLAPLESDYYLFSDPGGRYTARIPNAWSNRQDVSPNSVIFREPGPLWGAELALNDGSAFTTVEQADPIINDQVSQRPNYRPISLDRVMVGPFNAFRRVFEHTNDEGQTEIIVRIYFLAGPWLYNVNGFMLTPDYAQVAPLVDGIAGSITVVGAPPAATPTPTPAAPSPAPTTAPPAPTAIPPTATLPPAPTAIPPTATPVAPGTAVPTATPTPAAPRPTATTVPQPTPPATGSGGTLPGLPNTGDGGGGGGGPLLGTAVIVALLGLALRVRALRHRA